MECFIFCSQGSLTTERGRAEPGSEKKKYPKMIAVKKLERPGMILYLPISEANFPSHCFVTSL